MSTQHEHGFLMSSRARLTEVVLRKTLSEPKSPKCSFMVSGDQDGLIPVAFSQLVRREADILNVLNKLF